MPPWTVLAATAAARLRGSRLQLTLGLVAGLMASCAHPSRQQAAQAAFTPLQQPAPTASPAAVFVAPAGRAPSAVALGVFEVELPGCGAAPSAAEQAFCTSASRAVRRAYEEDNDDPSLLLALANDLEVNPALSSLLDLWRNQLGHALARSEALRRLGPTLRLLRRAVADAYLDQVSQIYRGVDTQACRAAFALLPAGEPHWLEMVVTIEPLGTYPLSRLRRFCLDSRTL